MKKNLWVLLALSALIAMFVIAGCAPKPTTPTPTPTPTTSPTAPPADTKCPEVVSTQIVKGHSMFEWDAAYGEWGTWIGAFQVVINFDENIDPILSSCIYDTTKWTVKVKNEGRVIKEEDAIVEAVKIDGKRIILLAWFGEEGQIRPVGYSYSDAAAILNDGATPVDHQADNPFDIHFDQYFFGGLICSKDDAQLYADFVNGLQWYGLDEYDRLEVKKLADWLKEQGIGTFISTTTTRYTPPTARDVVSWKLDSSCVIGDDLGNYCCGFSGEVCCLEPVCTTCEEPCPFETPGGTCQ